MAKKKIRFNVVDAVLILFVAAAFIIVGYFFLGLKNAGNEKNADGTEAGKQIKLQYVLKIADIKEMFLGNVEKGDEIIDIASGKKIGTVIALSSAPSKWTGTDPLTGSQVLSEIEGRSNLYITVEATAEFTDNKYFVDGVGVMVGVGINFMTPDLYSAASVVSVEPVE